MSFFISTFVAALPLHMAKMKKAARIIVISILSLMVIHMGVGVVAVHCAHSGDVSTMLTSHDACPDKPCCHHDDSGCMSYDLAKLSPFNVGHQTMLPVCVAHADAVAAFFVGNAGLFTEKSAWSELRPPDRLARSSRFRLSRLCVLRL